LTDFLFRVHYSILTFEVTLILTSLHVIVSPSGPARKSSQTSFNAPKI